jgi:uncharacterized protein (DUF58 family)
LERLRVAIRRNRVGLDAGGRSSPARGSSVEFADFRSYTLGDDPRRLDWNAYARLGRLFLRLYHDDQNANIHLFLDVSPSMDWGAGEANKLRWAKRLIAALAYIGLAELDRVTITPVAAGIVGRTTTYTGPQNALRLFEQIAHLPVAEEITNLDAALPRFKTRPSGPAILVSDLLCPGWGRDGLFALQVAGYEAAVIHVLSPEEEEPDARGDLRLVDRETGQTREVTVNDALLDRYQKALAIWKEEIRTTLHTRSIAYLPARSDEPLDDFIFGALRRERVVA